MSAQSNHPRADWEADEKRRPRLYTGKGEEEEEKEEEEESMDCQISCRYFPVVNFPKGKYTSI
jgi:hypothetical protein